MMVSPGKISLNAVRHPITLIDRINRANVHRFLCIATLAVAFAPLVSAQQDSERPQPLPGFQTKNEPSAAPSAFPLAKGAEPAVSAVQIANPPPPDTPPPGAPATVKLQFPNSDVVDVL